MLSVGFSGHYRLEVRDGASHKLTRIREFENLITDSGLDAYGFAYGKELNRCHVGSGQVAASPLDTALGAEFAYHDGIAETTYISPVAPDWVSGARLRYRFDVGQATGNIAEVGVGSSNSPYLLFSRALVVDSEGNPSPITVLPNEYLDVVYTLRLHPNLNDIPFSFNLGGVTYSGTARPAFIQDSRCSADSSCNCLGALAPNSGLEISTVYNGGTLGQITQGIQNPTRTVGMDYRAPWSAVAYTRGDYFRDFKHTASLDFANVEGGITAMLVIPRPVGNYGTLGAQFQLQTQMVFDKPIPKDSTNSIVFTLRCRWGRWTGS